ncbi:unnamed protein product [Protopolystoma xenopodis]|uniref:Bestrophin homolog n=1 Tax=Protopolystoma xenopodis TaxID=117903 RepID=A0A448WZW9_9PLAT|nr:unnamed protein product [Protopolystoma xenopodis]
MTKLCIYCGRLNEKVPVAFVLGFYVTLVVGRWWDQFMSLPWPDEIAFSLTAFFHGTNERAICMRRSVMRYVNLSFCLALRNISSRARLRFPQEQHLLA